MIIKQYSFLLPVPRGIKFCPWYSCPSLLASLSVPFFFLEGKGVALNKRGGAAVQARLLRCDRTEETKNSGKRTGVVGAVGHCPTDWTSGGDVLSFSVWRRCPLWAANPLPGSKGPQARWEHTRGVFPSEWGSRWQGGSGPNCRGSTEYHCAILRGIRSPKALPELGSGADVDWEWVSRAAKIAIERTNERDLGPLART